jgi:hypothetical protein
MESMVVAKRTCARPEIAGSMIGSTASFSHSLGGLSIFVLPSLRLAEVRALLIAESPFRR